MTRATVAAAVAVLTISCTDAPMDAPAADADSAVIRAALEYVRAEHPSVDSVAPGYGVPFLAGFEVDAAVSDLGESAGFEICTTGSDCSLLLGRAETDVARGRAEMHYTTRSRVAGMASVTIWTLELTLEDGSWTVENRREVSHYEAR